MRGRTLNLKGFALVLAITSTSLWADGVSPSAPTVFALTQLLHTEKLNRRAIEAMLGQPSNSFEHEEIYTWRLHIEDEHVSVVQPWADITHSLVIVVDSNGAVLRYALVQTRK